MIAMRETLLLVLAWAAGTGLGGLYFAGLWWTIRRGLASKRPALLLLGSMLVRTAALLAGFYYVSGGHWQRLLACVLGFVTARLIATRLAQPPRQVSHAP